MTVVLYFYQDAFLNNDFGYGAAIAWALPARAVVHDRQLADRHAAEGVSSRADTRSPSRRRPMATAPDRGIALHVFLMLGVLLLIFPFYWTLIMATNTTADIYRFPPKLTFGSHLDDNVRHVLDNVDFFGSMANTVIVAISTTLLVLFFDSLAAFAFAKFRFPGRNALFVLLLATLMLPAPAGAPYRSSRRWRSSAGSVR